MADAITAIISQLPPGVSPWDGLRAYFISQVYHRTNSFDRGCYAIISFCGYIVLATVISLLLRWRSNTLTWIIKDGAMTRPDFRIVCPTVYALFSSFEIVQSVVILRAYRDQHWTAFGGAFQYMSLSAVVVTGYVLFVNILASTPVVRRALMNAGSVSRSRGPLGIVILNSLLLLAILASIASLVPSAIILAKNMPGQNDDIKAIFAVIATAEEANDLTQLSGLMAPVGSLQHRGDQVKYAIQLAGWTTVSWLTGLWTLLGTMGYISLVRAVRQRIAKLQRYMHDEETRHAETQAMYSTVVELPHGGKRAGPVRTQPKLSADKPFANLMATTDMPDKYETILSSQLSETSQKIKQLKAVLKRDILDHCLYLIMILIFTSESIMHAAGAINHVETTKILPMVHSYLAAAFLSTAIPLITLFLLDSIRIFRLRNKQYSPDAQFRGRTFPTMTFDIPLSVTTNSRNEKEDLNVANNGSRGGIQVSQVHEVVVESSMAKDVEKDDEYSQY